MPEGLSPTEVAHELGHHHSSQAGVTRHQEIVEILEACLLAIVAVATAWSGYQTARFDGRQAHLYGTSSKLRALSTQASTLSGQERLYDNATMTAWLQAVGTHNPKLAELFQRRFRPEFRVAFHAWLATSPFTNSKAPPGPLFMRQYRNANSARSASLDRQATAAFEEGTQARESGDKYLRNTVLLATVLFLAALSQRFKVFRVRLSLIVVSAVLLAVALYFVFTYPRA